MATEAPTALVHTIGDASVIVSTELAITTLLEPPAAPAFRSAWRSDPGPASRPFVTVKVAAPAGDAIAGTPTHVATATATATASRRAFPGLPTLFMATPSRAGNPWPKLNLDGRLRNV